MCQTKIIGEIFEVMSRPKFNTATEIIERYVYAIEKLGRKIFITGTIKGVCRDKKDDDKIECAVLCDADYLIAGDDDLLVLNEYKNLKIITVKDYLKKI